MGRSGSNAKRWLNREINFSPTPASPPSGRATIGQIMGLAQNHATNGNLAMAEHLALQAAGAAPDFADVWLFLTNLYQSGKAYEQCIHAADKVLALRPTDHQALVLKARGLFKQDRIDDALVLMHRAIELAPGAARYHGVLGSILMATGSFEDARDAFDRAIALDGGLLEAHIDRLNLPNVTISREDIRSLQALAEDPELGAHERAVLDIAIGKGYRQLNDIDKEFEFLKKGNDTLARLAPWDVDELDRIVKCTIQGFTREMVERGNPTPSGGSRPIVICSLPRAGSTLTGQILGAHPEVTALGETGIAAKAVHDTMVRYRLGATEFCDWLKMDLADTYLAHAAQNHQRRLQEYGNDTPWAADKSASNDLLLGLWMLACPASKIVHVRRHPLSICLSAYQIYFSEGVSYSHRLDWLADRCLQHDRLMAHWKTQFPDQIFTLQYEELVEKPRETIAGLLDFVGLAWNDNCLRFDQHVNTVRTASNWQVREQLYTSSLARWRDYVAYLQPAIETLGLDVRALDASSPDIPSGTGAKLPGDTSVPSQN